MPSFLIYYKSMNWVNYTFHSLYLLGQRSVQIGTIQDNSRNTEEACKIIDTSIKLISVD